ncbi:MAG: hypothetical protein N0A16_06565 [Blastocatellia bacterium]|nr:hypothetical protein [Blastocatellia bacterium]MCS7157372.1 hypothetical protein [Blastocatellia bacterium]MCX7753238.1 hypothetical protein [Blastocatellia bacterium]MDW8168277.1 hypothetical protein [Acidobacteriota bacterium]MDW8255430.1 hypothetical protein [Acidobacteriota bacterium]
MTPPPRSEWLVLVLLGAALAVYIGVHWPLTKATGIVVRHLLGW